MDELLTDEHKLVRDSARAGMKKEVATIIEDGSEKGEFSKHHIQGLGEEGAMGHNIPEQ